MSEKFLAVIGRMADFVTHNTFTVHLIDKMKDVSSVFGEFCVSKHAILNTGNHFIIRIETHVQ